MLARQELLLIGRVCLDVVLVLDEKEEEVCSIKYRRGRVHCN